MAAAVVVVVAAVLLGVASAAEFHVGDSVSMLKRGQYRGYRSDWSTVFGAQAPRFGVESRVALDPLVSMKEYYQGEEFKLSFSFGEGRALVPWVTIADGQGLFAEQIMFEFEYSGDRILGVRAFPSYHADNRRDRPAHIYLHYVWREFDSRGTAAAAAMHFLLVAGALGTWAIAALVLFNRDKGPLLSVLNQRAAAAASSGAAGPVVAAPSPRRRKVHY